MENLNPLTDFLVIGVAVASALGALVSYFATRQFEKLRRRRTADLEDQIRANIQSLGALRLKHFERDPADFREEVPVDIERQEEESEDKLAESITAALREATSKSWWERWGATFAVGLVAALAVVASAWLSFIRTDPPDCTAYANTLIALREQAVSPEAAVSAAGALTWGELDEACGSAADFVESLG